MLGVWRVISVCWVVCGVLCVCAVVCDVLRCVLTPLNGTMELFVWCCSIAVLAVCLRNFCGGCTYTWTWFYTTYIVSAMRPLLAAAT